MIDPQREHKRISLTMQVLAWLALLAVLLIIFEEVLETQHNPNRKPASSVRADGVREVALKRNRAGHYVSAGSINGEPVVFLLDTGATGVAIPAAIAERLGLERGRALLSNTANGVGRSYSTQLAEVGLGDIRLQDVPAAITPGLQMSEVLLGMSFLKHIEFTQRGNTLTLRQYPGS